MSASKIIALLLLGSMSVACAASAEEETAPPEVKVETESDTSEPAYGSTYASNCYCSFCTKYCTVNGRTYKSGTCC